MPFWVIHDGNLSPDDLDITQEVNSGNKTYAGLNLIEKRNTLNLARDALKKLDPFRVCQGQACSEYRRACPGLV